MAERLIIKGAREHNLRSVDLDHRATRSCPECSGLDIRKEVDPELVVPDPDLTLAEGAASGPRVARVLVI